MEDYKDQYEWKGKTSSNTEPENEEPAADGKKKKREKSAKVKVYKAVLYSVAGLLILAGCAILFNELVLIKEDRTDNLVSESDYINDVYPELEKIEPLATPVDDYDNIPVMFHFIERDASCNIYPTGIEDDGTMGTVPQAEGATWLSVEPYAEPGKTGNAVISGHNLWKGKAGTFSLLKKLKLGEQVAVTFDKGFTRYFEVVEKYECAYNDTKPMQVNVDEPILTLITCKGNWDHHLQQSKERIVVICKPVTD